MAGQNLPQHAFRYLKRCLRRWTRPEARALRQLRRSIGRLPRHQSGRVKIWGWDLEFVDAASCISAFDYIVVRKWLDFVPQNSSPRILDCGANIGISVLHFKQLFPHARITAFEPDPHICEVLRHNLRANNASDVQVVEAALWDTEEDMFFAYDNADGGHLVDINVAGVSKQVKTQRLSHYLFEPIDLLKMDIEGSEGRVLRECAANLANIAAMIIEYHSVVGRPEELGEILSVLERNCFRYHINSDGIWRGFANPAFPLMAWLYYYLMIYAKRDSCLNEQVPLSI